MADRNTDVKTLNVNGDFRTFKEGELIKLVEGGQPVVFEGIIKSDNPKRIDDITILVCLDPVDGLDRREYALYEDGALR